MVRIPRHLDTQPTLYALTKRLAAYDEILIRFLPVWPAGYAPSFPWPLRLALEILARDLAKGLVIRRSIIIKNRVDTSLLA